MQKAAKVEKNEVEESVAVAVKADVVGDEVVPVSVSPELLLPWKMKSVTTSVVSSPIVLESHLLAPLAVSDTGKHTDAPEMSFYSSSDRQWPGPDYRQEQPIQSYRSKQRGSRYRQPAWGSA